MSDAVNQAGGGRVELRRVTYIVGRQVRIDDPARRFLFEPEPIMIFTGCRDPLAIIGNGAIIRAAPGLRYGTFDRGSGRVLPSRQNFYDEGVMASPYVAMLLIKGCSGAISVTGLELDGQSGHLLVGGGWGDNGWQVPGTGITLMDNSGAEILTDVFSHDHPGDGLIIDGVARTTGAPRVFTRVRADRNGRQGCSLVGGHGYTFVDCRFERSGRGPVASSPGAGFDIEAEAGKTIRALRFERCVFADNVGVGMVADSGDSADVTFANCEFIGTTGWAAWPNKPGMRFSDCRFVGAICNCFGGTSGATQFLRCTFSDSPALSPTRAVYLGGARDGTIADLSTSVNVRFDQCRFELVANGRLPWSTGAIYADCVMRQTSPIQSYPRGTYLGRSTITGNVGLDGARVVGSLTVNGRPQPRG